VEGPRFGTPFCLGFFLRFLGLVAVFFVLQSADPAAEIVPSGQLVQEEAPSPLKVFSPHC
jgi:hypothetical protein